MRSSAGLSSVSSLIGVDQASDREAGESVVDEQHAGLFAEALKADRRIRGVRLGERLLDAARSGFPVAADAREREERRNLADALGRRGEIPLRLLDEITGPHEAQHVAGLDGAREQHDVVADACHRSQIRNAVDEARERELRWLRWIDGAP